MDIPNGIRSPDFLHCGIFVVATICFMQLGCQPNSGQNPEDSGVTNTANVDAQSDISSTNSGADESAATENRAPRVSVEVIDIERYNELIAGAKGDVILVDFWATWCHACMEQFPHTVEISRRLKDQGLTVMSVSLDSPEDYKDDVLNFLQSQNADIVNTISQYGSGVESVESFGIIGGVLPYYKLYDRMGQLRYQFSGLPTEGLEDLANLDRRINELLAETPSK